MDEAGRIMRFFFLARSWGASMRGRMRHTGDVGDETQRHTLDDDFIVSAARGDDKASPLTETLVCSVSLLSLTLLHTWAIDKL